jgi:hypothetical protein
LGSARTGYLLPSFTAKTRIHYVAYWPFGRSGVGSAITGVIWHQFERRTERTQLADTKAERRRLRKITKQREDEARWLQKVLFDLSKASDAREKLVETTDEELNPLITLDDDTQIPLDKLEEIIQKRVDDLRDSLGQGAYNR